MTDVGNPEATGLEAILAAVTRERARQDMWFGADQILRHSSKPQLVLLMEEVGELARAVLEQDHDGIRAGAIQVAAVAVALVEAHEHRRHTVKRTRQRRVPGSNGRRSSTASDADQIPV